MRIINDREVELSDTEQRTYDYFHALLDEGYSIHRAALIAETCDGGDSEFYDWLAS